MFNSAFNGAKVLVTGHTGFKGYWLTLWLLNLGAKVIGVSNTNGFYPENVSALEGSQGLIDLREDIRNLSQIKKIFSEHQPDYVFHLAAQALVSESYDEPIKTFETNALGTVNILESLRSIEKQVVAVFVTSDKVYENFEWKWGYRETDKIGGKDPYSASKGMAEIAISSYAETILKNKFKNIKIGIGRAGNVIGGGDLSANRLIPDCVKAWFNSEQVVIRNPNSTRPWQHVLEPLSGYLALAAELKKNGSLSGEAFNFGPNGNNFSVLTLIQEMQKKLSALVACEVNFQQNSMDEANLLQLNCDKAMFDLKWAATLNFQDTVKYTTDWYISVNSEKLSARLTSIAQINQYVEQAQSKGIAWALQ